jgi:imidazolonepropionase-like amidohydrolase
MWYFQNMNALFAAASGLVFLQGAVLVDPRTQKVEMGSLLVDSHSGKIEARLSADAKPPAGARVVDLKGKYILPGLVDLHVHSWGNATPAKSGVDDDPGHAAVLARMLYGGVTAILDLGSELEEILPLRDRQRANPDAVPGASLFAAGPVMGYGHPDPSGSGYFAMSTPEEAHAQVRRLAAHHPDVIKVIFDHVMAGRRRGHGHGQGQGQGHGPGMTREIFAAAAAEAKAQGLRTVVHIGTWQDARDAVLGGASVITHLFDSEKIPIDLAKLMHERGVLEIPTMAVQGDLFRISKNPSMLENPLLVALTPPALRADYRKPKSDWKDRAQGWLGWQQADIPIDLESLRRLRDNGVTVLAGSDSANYGAFQGYSIHREIQIFREAGFSAWEALSAGSTRAAEFLGLRYGLESGDQAELVVLGASPVEDVANTERVEGVVHLGRYWSPEARKSLRSKMAIKN